MLARMFFFLRIVASWNNTALAVLRLISQPFSLLCSTSALVWFLALSNLWGAITCLKCRGFGANPTVQCSMCGVLSFQNQNLSAFSVNCAFQDSPPVYTPSNMRLIHDLQQPCKTFFQLVQQGNSRRKRHPLWFWTAISWKPQLFQPIAHG